MSDQVDVEIIVTETCCNCGITFGITKGFKDKRLSDGKSFYCPNGHSQYYTKSDAQRIKDLQKQIAAERENATWWANQAKSKARSLSATRGQVTKIKNRIADGYCPCCNHRFDDLKDHMDQVHPGYANQEQKITDK